MNKACFKALQAVQQQLSDAERLYATGQEQAAINVIKAAETDLEKIVHDIREGGQLAGLRAEING